METKKNILILSDYFIPHWTGLSKSILYLSNDLISCGCDVTVLTVQYSKALKRNEQVNNISIVRIPYFFRVSRVYYSLLLPLFAISYIKKHNDILINCPNSNILFLSIIAKLFRKKLLIFYQGDLILPASSTKKIIEFVYNVMTGASLFLADTIMSYTKDYALHSRLLPYFTKKFIAYIPTFTMKEVKNKKTENFRERIKKIRLQTSADNVIGFAGRFVEEKGFDYLLRAIPLLVSRYPRIHFVFAGETALLYEDFFQKNLNLIDNNKKNITFLGLLDSDELYFFYKECDAFVVASRSDCFNLTQLEAFYCKTPIVTVNIPGGRWLVQHTKFGTIAEPKNSQSLADEIGAVIEQKEIILKRWQQGSTLLKKYSDPKLLDRIIT